MQKNKKVTLSIIIVNWNSGDHLRKCILSIEKAKKENIEIKEIIIVDNSSTDDSLRKIHDLILTTKINIIRNDKNIGFAAACNMGAGETESDYILFLNPDSVLLEESLIKPIEFMEEETNKNIGIIGIQLIDEKWRISKSCNRFPRLNDFLVIIFGINKIFPKLFKTHKMTDWNHKTSRIVEQVVGAFFLVRYSLYKKLDGFDERYFVYYEEVDFSIRAKKLGYYSYYYAEARAIHTGGGCTEKAKSSRIFYNLRSRILYVNKHIGALEAFILHLLTLFIEPVTRIFYALFWLKIKDIKDTVIAFRELYLDTPKIIKLCIKGENENITFI